MADLSRYSTGTPTDRARVFLQECAAADVPWRRAAIILAVSMPETAMCAFTTRDAAHSIFQPLQCYPVRPVLAIERGSSRLNTDIPASWRRDEQLLSYLKGRGWLSSNGLRVAGDADKIDKPWDGKPNNAAAQIFEWIIDMRRGALLDAFSVGMTQMFLEYSPLAGGSMHKRFTTWESLWAFYTAGNGGVIASHEALDYLPTNVSTYPTLDTSDASNQQYLSSYQVGRTDWSTAGRQQYYNSFMSGLRIAWQTGSDINYPEYR